MADELSTAGVRVTSWSASDHAALAVTIPLWVDWFNNHRLLEPIGHVPPAEAEAAYYAALEEPAALAA